jgi:carbon storage regulator
MLVLTRKLGESIIIDDNIEVVVLKLANGLVKLGVKAPRETSVHRAEVAQKIIEETKNECVH